LAGLGVTPEPTTTFDGNGPEVLPLGAYGVVDTDVISWQLLFGAAVVSVRRGNPYVVLISVVSSAS
jgi:hypothetical protein